MWQLTLWCLAACCETSDLGPLNLLSCVVLVTCHKEVG